MAKQISCGILLYRITDVPEFFLVHPGGIYNKNALWGIPKGHVEKDERFINTAIREFQEEVGANIIVKNRLITLGYIKQNKNKNVYCWGYNYDLGDNYEVKSILTEIEYPKNSGLFINVPEIDKGKYFTAESCKDLIIRAQFEFIVRLINILERK